MKRQETHTWYHFLGFFSSPKDTQKVWTIQWRSIFCIILFPSSYDYRRYRSNYLSGVWTFGKSNIHDTYFFVRVWLGWRRVTCCWKSFLKCLERKNPKKSLDNSTYKYIIVVATYKPFLLPFAPSKCMVLKRPL